MQQKKINYLPLIFISTPLLTTIFLLENLNWFMWYWIIFPFIVPLSAALLQLAGKLKSQVIPISGAITSILPIPFYLESLTHVTASDGQAALIFAVMPVYQLVGLVILSIAGNAVINWKKKHRHN